MKKTLFSLTLAAVLALGAVTPGHASSDEDNLQLHRAAAFGTGMVTAMVLDQGLNALAARTMPDKKPSWASRMVITALTMITVVGVEAARQAGAHENGVDYSNLTFGVTGALVGFSYSW